MSRTLAQRWERAQGYLARREPGPARAQLEAMRALAPGDARTRVLAAQVAWHDDHMRVASTEALAAARAQPADAAVACEVVAALLQAGEVVAARQCLDRPVLAASAAPAILMRVADFRQQLNEHAASLAAVEQAIAAGATDPDVEFHHGAQLYFHGRLADAEAALQRCLAAAPGHGRAAFTLSALRRQIPESNHLAQLAAGLARAPRGSLDHAAFEFARYKEFEDLGRNADAWQALAAGNAVMHARKPFDAAREVGFLDRLIATCGAERLPVATTPDDGPQPIFILGLPRSGTTLLERLLGAHPQVQSTGELVDFGAQLRWAADTRRTHSDAYLQRIATLDFAELGERYLAQTRWRAQGKRWFIDKQPPNWEAAGLIHAALPHARILHLVRDPLDVCFSNWRAFFADAYTYSYHLPTLAAWYRGYARVMRYWHRCMPGAILDVPYTRLATDTEATLHDVLDYCGLAWDPACLDLARNLVPVMTLSARQVRGGVRPHSGEWQRYAGHLQPLRAALGID